MRGDISGFTKILKGYWEDKRKYPWHRIYKLIAKNWEKEKRGDVGEALIQIRDGVFGALDIHSLSLALNIPNSEILNILLKGKSWNEGRKSVRTYCAKEVTKLCTKQKVDFLDEISLERDGFGYLIDKVTTAKLNQYRKAKPDDSKKELDLKALHTSVHGRLLLRDLGISKKSIPSKSPEATTLLQAYETRLIELETDLSDIEIPTGPTEQLTLDGEPVEEDTKKSEEKKKKKKSKDTEQTPLTEYMSGKKASRKRRKKRRRRKKKE